MIRLSSKLSLLRWWTRSRLREVGVVKAESHTSKVRALSASLNTAVRHAIVGFAQSANAHTSWRHLAHRGDGAE